MTPLACPGPRASLGAWGGRVTCHELFYFPDSTWHIVGAQCLLDGQLGCLGWGWER